MDLEKGGLSVDDEKVKVFLLLTPIAVGELVRSDETSVCKEEAPEDEMGDDADCCCCCWFEDDDVLFIILLLVLLIVEVVDFIYFCFLLEKKYDIIRIFERNSY